MEVKERLRRIIQGFNQELNEKLRPVFIDSYQCEMECYEKLTVLDDADALKIVKNSQILYAMISKLNTEMHL